MNFNASYIHITSFSRTKKYSSTLEVTSYSLDDQLKGIVSICETPTLRDENEILESRETKIFEEFNFDSKL